MRRITAICCMIAFAISFCGCGTEAQNEEGKYIVFDYAGEEICLDEVYIYAQTTTEEYVQEYGADIWSDTITTDDGLEMTVEDMARRQVISDIVTVKTLVAQADGYGVTLTAEEEAQMEEEAEDFYSNLTDEQIEETSMELDTVIKVKEENLLADKVYDYAMKGNDLEVSDEQARMTTFYDMFFECYYEDDFGNIIVYSADEIAEQKEKAYAAYDTIQSQMSSEDFNITFLGYTYGLVYAGSHTMSKDEITETYGEDVLGILYGMSDGEISQVVETEYGYHIFQMTALTDEAATAENKETLSEAANEEYFNNLLSSWMTELDKDYSYAKSVNQDVYVMITFQ